MFNIKALIQNIINDKEQFVNNLVHHGLNIDLDCLIQPSMFIDNILVIDMDEIQLFIDTLYTREKSDLENVSLSLSVGEYIKCPKFNNEDEFYAYLADYLNKIYSIENE